MTVNSLNLKKLYYQNNSCFTAEKEFLQRRFPITDAALALQVTRRQNQTQNLQSDYHSYSPVLSSLPLQSQRQTHWLLFWVPLVLLKTQISQVIHFLTSISSCPLLLPIGIHLDLPLGKQKTNPNHVETGGRGEHTGTLCFVLNFAVNLKLLYKIKFINEAGGGEHC